MKYVFCAYRSWALELYKKLSKRYKNMILIKNPKKLTYSYIKKINPKFIFFPDWSWIVPTEIVNNFTCICFHESNLQSSQIHESEPNPNRWFEEPRLRDPSNHWLSKPTTNPNLFTNPQDRRSCSCHFDSNPRFQKIEQKWQETRLPNQSPFGLCFRTLLQTHNQLRQIHNSQASEPFRHWF